METSIQAGESGLPFSSSSEYFEMETTGLSGRKFSQDQLLQMQELFDITLYPSRKNKEELATKFNVEYKSVDNWFKKRRLIYRNEQSTTKKSKHFYVYNG